MKGRIKYYLTAFICTMTVLITNGIVPSYMNGFPTSGLNFEIHTLIDNEIATEVFESRYNSPIFRARPLVIETQRILKEYFNLPYQLSFNIINTIFIFIFFILIANVDFIYTKKSKIIFRQALFLFSMPILFSFFGSICTYDDFVQYVFILIFIHFLKRENHLLSAIALTIACITRETSFLFYFIILSYLYIEKPCLNFKVLTYLLPIIIYPIFLEVYFPKNLIVDAQEYFSNTRLYLWQRNFRTWETTRETMTIITFMTAPFLIMLYNKLHRVNKEKKKKWIIAFILFIIINAIIVSLMSLVRENRLLFLPLLHVIPYLTVDIEKVFRTSLKELKINYKFLIILLVCGFFAFWFYTPKTHGTGYIFKVFIFFKSIFYMFLLIRWNDVER